MTLFDTHAHLDDERFAADLPAVLARAQGAGVGRVLTIGIDRRTSENASRLAAEWPMVQAVVGIQPNCCAEASPGDFDAVAVLLTQPKVVAVGETGLDRYWDKAPFELQIDYFRRHLQLASGAKLPVVIHCREAEADVIAELERHAAQVGPVRGVMHSFSGDELTARRALELGLHVSFAGMVTYKTAESLRQVARIVPADRILVETDSPYLAPVPMRGKRNEPAFVAHTLAVLAQVRGEPAEELAARTTANAVGLFGGG